MNSNMISLITFGVLLLFGAIMFIYMKKSPKSQKSSNVQKNNSNNKQGESAFKKNPNANVNKEDIFKFMDFDKIQDNMIVQNNGQKYTAVIKCKGINYNLMSEVEQLSVEEGFINFLNTLKFPIQIYVQAQNIDLKDNINKYKESMKEMYQKYDDINSEYGMVINSLDSTDEEIEKIENERSSILNVLEYGQDIVKYVERLSLNKNMLQRSFYVLVSYYQSEITNASNFNKEELLDICYTELFTRVQNIMSGLAMSSVSSEILESNDLAELLYLAYNRDDKNYIDVKQALESGFHRLYSTSKDAITKKHERLIEGIRREAEYKAITALSKAVEEGNVLTTQDVEDQYDEASSKQAIEIIKKEKVDESVKEAAKKIVINEYKKSKKERNEKKEKELNEMVQKINGQSEDNVADSEANDSETTDIQANDENESIV